MGTMRISSKKLKSGGILAALFATLAGLVPAIPALAAEEQAVQGEQGLPAPFGEVVFQIPGNGDRHLYIIGHSHRSARTGANGAYTVQAQAEVYRIGEWLIRQKNVQLLLPEGFFRRKTDSPPATPQKIISRVSLDNEALREKLADTSVFVNADMLLRANYQIQLHQVEDPQIYQAVSRFLQTDDETEESARQLDFLQEVRSAVMLQNIPDAIEFELQSGNIENRQAIFTIGMAHIDEIVRFLREGSISLTPPAVTLASYQEVNSLLKLIAQGYGVTVIIPRSLSENREVLRLADNSSI